MLNSADIARALGCSTRHAATLMPGMGAIDISLPGSRRPLWRVAEEDFRRWRDAEPGRGEFLVELKRAAERAYINEQVYFLAGGGLIKIGYSSNLDGRLADLRKASPVPLELAAVTRGDVLFEKWLHARFAEGRTHGEWFRPIEELVRAIDLIRGAS